MTLVLHGPSFDPSLPVIAPEALASDINAELVTFWLPLSGGTLNGPLYLSGPPHGPNEAATKAYVDAHAGSGPGSSAADIEAYFAALPNSDAGVAPGGMFWNGGFLTRVAGGGIVGLGTVSDADIEAYFAALPTSDAGLFTGNMFWNGGFLCRKI